MSDDKNPNGVWVSNNDIYKVAQEVDKKVDVLIVRDANT